MKCPTCHQAELITDTRDMPYTYKGETTTIQAVTGDYCPACAEVITSKAESRRIMAAMLVRSETMTYSLIKTEAQNEAALERLLELGSQNEMTEAEAEEFEMLALLVKNYEDKHYKIDTSEVTPLDIIKFRMEQTA